MTEKEATALLGRVLSLKNAGMPWNEIAMAMRIQDGKVLKKLAKQAARISQDVLLRNTGFDKD